jgi:hypothetical protein
MRKPNKITRRQFPLFPPTRVEPLPRVLDPQVVRLLAQLLRQYVNRTPARPEDTHE